MTCVQKLFFGFFLAAILLPGLLGAAEWVPAGRDKLYDAEFVPPDSFWVVGYPGKILSSRDGGRTWEEIKAEGEEALFAVEFPNPVSGWIAGRGGLILHTRDGGKTWNRQESGVSDPLFDLAFVDGKRGWAVGHFGVVLRTVDGGEHWTRQYLNPQRTETIAPDAEAFTVDESGSIFIGDAGAEREELPPQKEIDPSLNGVFFQNEKEGFAVGEFGTIFHTRDGGETWKPQVSGVETSLFAINFSDRLTGYAVGPKGVLLRTRDGGARWETIRVPEEENFFRVGSAGGELWMVGSRGVVLKGKAGGEGLTLVPLDIFSWLSGLAFGRDKVLLVGGNGKIISLPFSGVK